MADVILFRPKMTKASQMILCHQLPLGLLFIAGPLVKNNYKVKIIDEETDLYWLDDLNKQLNNTTICVGISAMTGRQILGGLNFARIVKDRFDIPVVWGGLHASMLPEQTVKNELVDIAVRGEGEEVFLKTVTTLQQGNNLNGIPNLCYKENGKIYVNPRDRFIDLNELSPLPYHLLDCEKYIKVGMNLLPNCRRILQLHTDRGCPHRCGFCYNINVNQCTWRHLDASRAVEQVEYLVKKFSLDGIDFVADNFFVDKNRVADICTEIIKRKIMISWHADCRIDYFARYDDEFINLLKESGCRSLTFGVESGSPRILELIHKDIELNDVFKVNEKLKKMQIWVGYHFMAGFPGETKKDIRHTYKVMLKLYEQYPGANFIGPSIYTPYPGTPLYYKCIEMGFKPPEKLEDWASFDWYENPRLPFTKPDYSKKWLMQSANIARHGTIHIKGFSWIAWWYRLRTKIIIKFNVVGPQPEESVIRLITLAKATILFAKKLMKKK